MSDNNPFATLEAEAKRQAAEEQAKQMIASARSQLVMGRRQNKERFNSQDKERAATCAFFASLALRLEASPSWEIPTAATDGKHLLYNPDFVVNEGMSEVIGVIAHEVLHVANCHHTRRGHREAGKWNIAADVAINSLLRDAGFALPKDGFFPGERPKVSKSVPQEWADAIAKFPPGLSAEEYYAQLPDPPGQGQGQGQGEGEGKGQGGGAGQDPGRCGGVKQPGDGSEAARKEAEAEAKVALSQAHQAARQRGRCAAGIDRLVEEVLAPRVDWKEVLREFISRHAKNDYCWSHPNRRFIHQGIYLPGLRSEELGDIVLAVDTSGSIGGEILQRFGSEIQGILDSYDVGLTILYHDAQVCHVQTWKSSDGPLVLEPRGGGGTDHCPVFAWVEEQGVDPACLVALTDMYSRFPEQAPGYPVLWASVVKGSKAPWGTLVEVG